MFSVGLEFSLPQLMAMRRTVFGFGAAQVGIVIAIVMAVRDARGSILADRPSCWAACSR